MSEQTITPNSEYVKPCRKCGAQDRYNADGRCRPCNRKNVRNWRETNPEKNAQNGRNWREANPGKNAEKARKWREANPERAVELGRKYRKANPEKVNENARKWQKANPEKAAEIRRNWKKANPESVRLITHNRRAKVKGNGGTLSKGIVKRLMTLQKGNCACGCGASLKETGYHLDHIMPIALGGLNDDANVQLLTPSCNLRKGAKHPDDWARDLGKLI